MAKKPKIEYPQRGEIYLIRFDPALGAEIKKTRPALILQNDVANRHSPITIVAAITSQFEEPLYPTEILIKAPEAGLTVDLVALFNQVHSYDKKRLIRRLGRLKPETMKQVDRALMISLGLVDI